jgi:hypothetical protein
MYDFGLSPRLSLFALPLGKDRVSSACHISCHFLSIAGRSSFLDTGGADVVASRMKVLKAGRWAAHLHRPCMKTVGLNRSRDMDCMFGVDHRMVQNN